MSHHSLKGRSSHSEESDVVEIKKALATSGVDKELAAPYTASGSSRLRTVMSTHLISSDSPSRSDCMLLSGLDSDDACEQGRLIRSSALMQEIDTPIVRRIRPKLFHELPPAMHPVICLLRLRCRC